MNRSTGAHSVIDIKLAIAAPPSMDVVAFLQGLSSHWPNGHIRNYTMGSLEVLCLEAFVALQSSSPQEVKMSLRVLSGQAHFHAIQEVLLGNADGMMIVLDMEPSQRNVSMQILWQTTQALRRQGREIHQIPIVLLYHRADLASAETLTEWDQLLEWERNQIPRFLSNSSQVDHAPPMIEALLQRVLDIPRLAIQSP